MAKQIGLIKITGTLGGITFYKMNKKFYARQKSSLDGERVKTDPRFGKTMAEAHGLGNASTAASEVYRQLPARRKGHGVIGRLTGKIRKLVRQGMDIEEAKLQIKREFGVRQLQKRVINKKKDDGFAGQLPKAAIADESKVHSEALLDQRKYPTERNARTGKISFSEMPVFYSGLPDFGYAWMLGRPGNKLDCPQLFHKSPAPMSGSARDGPSRKFGQCYSVTVVGQGQQDNVDA